MLKKKRRKKTNQNLYIKGRARRKTILNYKKKKNANCTAENPFSKSMLEEFSFNSQKKEKLLKYSYRVILYTSSSKLFCLFVTYLHSCQPLLRNAATESLPLPFLPHFQLYFVFFSLFLISVAKYYCSIVYLHTYISNKYMREFR